MTAEEESALLDILPPEIPIDEIHILATDGTGADIQCVPQSRRCTFWIEPAVVCLIFGLNLSGTIFRNQIIYQTCTSVFLYNASTCSLLGTANSTPESEKIETEVQPYAARIFMAKVILESVVPAFGGLFFGAWSDRNGRKPLLVAAFTGYSLIYIITSIICYISAKHLISPWYYILSVVPESILGGNCIFRIAIICFIADITTVEQRPIRMAFLEASIYIGLMTGSFAASYIYAATSALIVFTISASVIVLTTLYIIYFVPESLTLRCELPPAVTDEEYSTAVTRNPICEMLETCFKPREHQDRLIIWLIVSALFISVFVIDGVGMVFYLFVREKFHWTVRDYTIYETTATLVPIVGNIIGMLIMRKMFNVSVTALALLAIGSLLLNEFVKGIATKSWHIYLAVGMGAFKAVGAPMCKAIVSNIVPGTDLGKIFSFANVLESIAPFAAATLYTFVYSQTIASNPGAFNLLSTGMYLIAYILMAIIFGIKHSNRERYGTTL